MSQKCATSFKFIDALLTSALAQQRNRHNNRHIEDFHHKPITEDQARLLDELGFDWNPYKSKWDKRYQLMKEFKEEVSLH